MRNRKPGVNRGSNPTGACLTLPAAVWLPVAAAQRQRCSSGTLRVPGGMSRVASPRLASEWGSCRVASRKFATGCLTKNVTRHLTEEALNGLLPPHPHSLLQRIELSHAVPSWVTRLELDQQFKCSLIRALL